MSDKVRIGLVGCGDIAGAHLEGYQLQAESGCQHFEVVALCDPVEEARGRCAEKLRSFQAGEPEQFGALDDLIAAGIVDGVDVCTPHGDHHTTAVACLDAGVHVLVEKPLGITIKAAKQIEAAAKRTGKILSVAENARRGLGPRAMAWLFNENRMIGAPRMFVSERIEGRKLPSNQTGEAGEAMADEEPLEELNWRNLYRLCGGGWTFDGGVHMMDALQVYFGDAESVFADQRKIEPASTLLKDGSRVAHEDEDTCMATIRFKNGVFGNWTWSTAMPGVDSMRVAYYCEDGFAIDQTERLAGTHSFGAGVFDSEGRVFLPDSTEISIRHVELEYLLSRSEEEKERLFPHRVRHSIAVECHEFVDCIREGRQPEIDAEAGLRGQALATAIYESAHSGQAVSVDGVIDGTVCEFQRPIDEHWGLS